MHIALILFGSRCSLLIPNNISSCAKQFIFHIRNLMAKQDTPELGFRNVDEVDTTPENNDKLESAEPK
jgi:hypothetical protein